MISELLLYMLDQSGIFAAVKLYRVAILLSLAVLASVCSLFYTPVKLIPEKPFYEPLPASLEDDYFHSPVGDIAGKYPKGWLLANIEHIAELENVAFVYTNSSRDWAMTLVEIPGSADLRRRYEQNGLLAIAEQSIADHRTKSPSMTITRAPEDFKESRMHFANYEVARGSSDSTLHSRYVVFTTGIRYYELGIVELRPAEPSGGFMVNYRLLQSVIGTLEGVPIGK